MASDMLRLAEGYARRGWHVFPIRAGTKDQPRVKWGSEAADSPEAVRKWWTWWPDDNIGIATSPSGLLVLDLDVKHGNDGPGELEAVELEHGEVPRTLTAETPSGGLHVYLQGTAATGVNVIGQGIDVRSAGGAGGYVLAPGSVLDETNEHPGSYSWAKGTDIEDPPPRAPAWLSELIGAARDRASERGEPEGPEDAEADVAWCQEYLETAEPAVEGSGGDSQTLATAMKLRDHGMSEGAALALMLETYNPRCSPSWAEHEMATKVANAYAYSSGAQGAESATGDFDDGEVEPAEETEARYGGIGDQWVWVANAKWFVERETGERLDRESFDSLYSHVIEGPKSFSQMVFKGKRAMRRLKRFCYRPTEPEFPEDGAYNTWRPSGVEPAAEGAPWFLEHITYLFPDEVDRRHALQFLAHVATKPDQRTHYALLIQGEEGTGKSFIHDLMELIVGRHNTIRVSNEELKSNYNAWAAGSQLCCISELMTHGRIEVMNKLKPLITDPFARVEEKFRSPYTVENHTNFIMLTNHMDAIPIQRGDRRYLCLVSPAKARPAGYYRDLFSWVTDSRKNGPGRVLLELSRVNMKGFNPKGQAPATLGKEDMRRASWNEIEQWILEAYELEQAPMRDSLVAVQDIVDALPPRMLRDRRLGNVISGFLKKELGAAKLGQHSLANGQRRVLWAIRRVDAMEAMPAPLRAAEYTRQWVRQDFVDLQDDDDADGVVLSMPPADRSDPDT